MPKFTRDSKSIRVLCSFFFFFFSCLNSSISITFLVIRIYSLAGTKNLLNPDFIGELVPAKVLALAFWNCDFDFLVHIYEPLFMAL
jgi:hypothetical protein